MVWKNVRMFVSGDTVGISSGIGQPVSWWVPCLGTIERMSGLAGGQGLTDFRPKPRRTDGRYLGHDVWRILTCDSPSVNLDSASI
jgi:hypothetical protein